jgi:pseudouridine synthase
MRLNKYIAQNSDYSRRAADDLISKDRVKVNGRIAKIGQEVSSDDSIFVNDVEIGKIEANPITIKLHKPTGYVCSRDGQGSPTVYELLPLDLQQLNYAGRLDKDSSGLLIMSNDGELINQLSHPRHRKTKVYEVLLDQPLQPLHQQMISDKGLLLSDGVSRLQIEKTDIDGKSLVITMIEGRNRQIRRTFEALGYTVQKLHRSQFGPYALGKLKEGELTVA